MYIACTSSERLFNLSFNVSCILWLVVSPVRLFVFTHKVSSRTLARSLADWLCLDILKHKTHISLSSTRINIFFLLLVPALASHIFNSTYLHNINMKAWRRWLYRSRRGERETLIMCTLYGIVSSFIFILFWLEDRLILYIFHSPPMSLFLWQCCTFTPDQIPLLHAHSTAPLLIPIPQLTFISLSRFVFIIITHIDVHSVAGSPFVVSCSSVSQSKLCIESLSPPPQPNMRYSMRFFFASMSWKSNHSFFHSHRLVSVSWYSSIERLGCAAAAL